MSKHTPEPWELDPDVACQIRQPRRSKRRRIKFPPDADGFADARHVVACVNACKGINPKAVPKVFEEAKRLLGRIERNPWTGVTDMDSRSYEALRAAIAKAEK